MNVLPPIVALLSCALLGCSLTPGSKATDAELAASRAFYDAQPRYLRPVPLQETPTGLPDLRASTCGACHQEIYAEWRLSTHAEAWKGDPQFQAELHKTREDGRDVRWMCVNCHTPLENQLPRLVTGLIDGDLGAPRYVDNPAFDPVLQDEAITCATCHVRDGFVLGPSGESAAPHPVRKGGDLLNEDVCLQCHQAEATFDSLNLSCAFGTGREFSKSPQAAAGLRCQSCHMPEVQRAIVPGGEPRLTRRHWFGGSLIAKRPELEAGLAPLRAHYPDGLELRWKQLPSSGVAGRQLTVRLEYENVHAGHRLPTGDPERALELSLRALDEQGAVLATASARVGAVYSWWPKVKKLSDNRLDPGEKRTLEIRFEPPKQGTVRLEAWAVKRRLSDEVVAFHQLEGKVVPAREFARLDALVEIKVISP